MPFSVMIYLSFAARDRLFFPPRPSLLGGVSAVELTDCLKELTACISLTGIIFLAALLNAPLPTTCRRAVCHWWK